MVDICFLEGVEGSERVFGSDRDISDEISLGSFTKFGSPYVKACIIQCGRCCVEIGGLKQFSRFCWDMRVDPK